MGSEKEMRFFKHMKKRHLEPMMDAGAIRLGTLYDYRRVEHYGEGIGDADEGKRRMEISFPEAREVVIGDGSFESEVLQGMIDFPEPGVIVKFGAGCKSMATNTTSPDYNLFCLSNSPDCSVDSGYDACVEILDVHAFMDAITPMVHATSTVFPSLGAAAMGTSCIATSRVTFISLTRTVAILGG
jgi:hypothetical protein